MGGVAAAARDAEALMERTVWKTLLWDILQGEEVKGQRRGSQIDKILSTTEPEVVESSLYNHEVEVMQVNVDYWTWCLECPIKQFGFM